jgi:hypothetical protein
VSDILQSLTFLVGVGVFDVNGCLEGLFKAVNGIGDERDGIS